MVDYYSNNRVGLELRGQLELGYNVSKISRWAYNLFYDHRDELSNELKEILKELARMEDDLQFGYTKKELHMLSEMLINNEKEPLKKINEIASKRSIE